MNTSYWASERVRLLSSYHHMSYSKCYVSRISACNLAVWDRLYS